ncbi:MAG: DUF4396 domain-containing protein [Halofilum sp. (in: g-proteobacteria)]
MTPAWLQWLSIASLILGAACAVWIAFDEWRRPQHMRIMNVVWPVTALFASVLAVWGYLRYGRLATHERAMPAMERGEMPPHMRETSFPAMVAKGTTHCGSGCTLGDIAAEWLALAFPTIAIWFGWQSLFEHKTFAVWILAYIFALAFGLAFQFWSIRPMRNLSVRRGLIEAAKADVLSLTAWQIGMYGFMAVAHFYIFRTLLGAPLPVASPEFWFMMQIAMLVGFVTSYPLNWWLLRAGIKERM